MVLLAEGLTAPLPSPDGASLLTWVLCFYALAAGTLGLWWMGRQLYISYYPPKRHRRRDCRDRYVTYASMDAKMQEIRVSIGERFAVMERAIDGRLGKLETNLIEIERQLFARIDDIDKNFRLFSDRSQSDRASIRSDLSYIRGRIEIRTGKRLGRPEELPEDET